MLKKMLSTALISLIMGGSVFADSNDIMNELKSKKEQGVSLYSQQQYEAAYEIFSLLYMSALSDVNINFLMGRCAFETGRYEMALASFERVGMLDPTNVRNQLELARTQYMLKMYEDSRNGFVQLLANPALPDTVRTNVQLFVSKIDGQLQQSFFFGTVKLGTTYDSNVNNGSNADYGIYSDSLKSNADFTYDAELALVHIYDIGQKNGFTVRNNLTLFNREYDTMSAFDMTYLSYNPALVYQELYDVYELNAMIDHMWLHHEGYMNGYSIMPNWIHKLDSTARLLTNFKYTRKDFIRTADEFRDANAYALSLAYQQLWASSYLTIRLTAEREKKLTGNRNDVDFDGYRLNADYGTQFYPTWSAAFDGEVKKRNYDVYSALFDNTREDSGYKAGATVTKKITPTLYVEAKAGYERTWSNQSVYEYNKKTCGVMLSKSF